MRSLDVCQVASSCFELLHNEFVNQAPAVLCHLHRHIVNLSQVVAEQDEPVVAQYHLDIAGESVGRRLCERSLA